jgi:rod shape determining protein RodA
MGFVGSLVVIALFVGLFLRVIYLSERQKQSSVEFMAIGVVGILFLCEHCNGYWCFPTIGVPLPFFFPMVGLACGDLLFYCLYS